jgi:hypothetical protein
VEYKMIKKVKGAEELAQMRLQIDVNEGKFGE